MSDMLEFMEEIGKLKASSASHTVRNFCCICRKEIICPRCIDPKEEKS